MLLKQQKPLMWTSRASGCCLGRQGGGGLWQLKAHVTDDRSAAFAQRGVLAIFADSRTVVPTPLALGAVRSRHACNHLPAVEELLRGRRVLGALLNVLCAIDQLCLRMRLLDVITQSTGLPGRTAQPQRCREKTKLTALGAHK